MATRQAIDSSRATSQVPALVEHGSRAARLLDAGIDPGLAAYLTRVSMDVLPPSQPGHSREGGDSIDDEGEHSP